MNVTVNDRMRNYIRDNHLKQTSIAAAMGIKDSTLSLMLNNKKRIYVDDLIKFCDAVGIDAGILLDYEVYA